MFSFSFKHNRHILLLLLLLGISSISWCQNQNIVYQDFTKRFTLISDGVIRMEYAPQGGFVDQPSQVVVIRSYPEVQAKVKKNGTWVEISTSKMTVRYKKGEGPFTADNLIIKSAKTLQPAFSWRPGQEPKGNLGGTIRTLDGMDGNEHVERGQPNKVVELEPGLLSKEGWTWIDDSESYLFDNDKDWPWATTRNSPSGQQDWYFMAYGHNYKQALADFTLFAGKMPMPPRYAFGYWWSRYWMYSDHELRELVRRFQQHDIPMDVMVIDMDWHYDEPGKGGWSGWTVNKELFPNMGRLLHFLKEQHLCTTLNLHPADGIATYEAPFKAMANELGADTTKLLPWVSSDKRFIQAVFRHALNPLREQGVDFWWLDWQHAIYDSRLPKLSNTWWLNYVFFSQMERYTTFRPMLYHRWGGLGNHRYPIGFSGDSHITWKSLDYQPYFTATASNVLYGYWSHDIGGHMKGTVVPEMYVRWMQFGAFSPIMRTHSSKEAHVKKEFWEFDAETGVMLHDIVRQRYAMAPYIYTMAHKAYETGLSLCRPMYYDEPEQEAAYTHRNQYMFGDQMLVAPITSPMEKQLATVNVWLPEGEWFEWYTGTMIQARRFTHYERHLALDEVPVYVKGGSILPFYGNKIQHLKNNDEPIIVTVFPGGGERTDFEMYEDNGNDQKYATEHATTMLTRERQSNTLKVTIAARQGNYTDMPTQRQFSVKVLNSAWPISVKVNGRAAEYRYDGSEFALVVDIPETNCSTAKVVEIVYPEQTPDLNELRGLTHRINRALADLKAHNSTILLKPELASMGSLQEAVTYEPENMAALIQTFRDNFTILPTTLQAQETYSPRSRQKPVTHEQALRFLDIVGVDYLE
ncbi:MAG: DUF5110 domain-containing protein [Bacteroidales bacterium]|nr:DUF5110 domain-containing protein [Bacteroidales bacterium]